MGCAPSYEQVTAPTKSSIIPPPYYYAISSNKWISLLQSILTDVFTPSLIQDMEKDIGTDIESFYTRLISGKTRLYGNNLTRPELYMYAGVIGVYYGPTSHKFEHITKNFVQYSTLELSEFKINLNTAHMNCMKPIEYNASFDKNDVTVLDDDVTILLLSNFATGTQRS